MHKFSAVNCQAIIRMLTNKDLRRQAISRILTNKDPRFHVFHLQGRVHMLVTVANNRVRMCRVAGGPRLEDLFVTTVKTFWQVSHQDV